MVKLQQIIPNNPNFQFQVADLLNKLTASVVTRGDLVTAGIISTTGNGTGGTVTKPPVGGGVISAPLPITGFTARGAFASVLLTWNAVTQFGYSYVEVWRNTVDDLATAIKIGTSIAPMYSDTPPDSKTSITYYYWVRAVNVNNISGAYNGIAGTVGSTANDPAYALEILTGKLTQTQLHSTLSTQIDNIAVNANAITTVNAITAGNTSSITTINSTVGSNSSTIQTQQSAIAGINAQYTVKTQVDINGVAKIAGFGLMNSGITSVFEIMADKFFIAPPAGSAAGSLSPFIVDATRNLVLMDGASIVDATITNAHINFVNGDTINAAISLTAPIISGGTVKLGNATSLAAGTGVFIDGNAGTGAFRAGDPLADHIKWDGATLYLKGSAQMALQAGSSISIGDVAGAGSLAALNIVGGANIDAAAVGTLQIGANAATSALGASGAASATLIGVNIATTGAVIIQGTGIHTANSISYLQYKASSSGTWITLLSSFIGGAIPIAYTKSLSNIVGQYDFRLTGSTFSQASITVFVSLR